MSTVDKLLWYIFALSALLIAVVFFVGLSTDAKTLLSSGRDFLYAVTGRDSSGAAIQYPNNPTGYAFPTNTGQTSGGATFTL